MKFSKNKLKYIEQEKRELELIYQTDFKMKVTGRERGKAFKMMRVLINIKIQQLKSHHNRAIVHRNKDWCKYMEKCAFSQ